MLGIIPTYRENLYPKRPTINRKDRQKVGKQTATQRSDFPSVAQSRTATK